MAVRENIRSALAVARGLAEQTSAEQAMGSEQIKKRTDKEQANKD